MTTTRQFRKLLAENRAFVAPAVFNPMTAKPDIERATAERRFEP